MTDDPRDELDRALGARLGAMASGDDDATAVLEEMRPGLRRARNRHRVARVSAAVVALAVVITIGAVVSSTSTRHGHVAVNSSPTTIGPAVIPNPTPKPPKTHDVTTTTRPNAPASATTAPGGHPAGGPAPTIPLVPAQPGSGGGEGPTTPPPTSSPPAQPIRYSAPGGTLEITCNSGRLQLVQWTANPGWNGSVHDDSAQEIQVRFTRGSHGSGNDGAEIRASDDNSDSSKIDVKVGGGGCAHLEVETE